MDIVNSALETALASSDKADWSPVTVNVASATLTILISDVSIITHIRLIIFIFVIHVFRKNIAFMLVWFEMTHGICILSCVWV